MPCDAIAVTFGTGAVLVVALVATKDRGNDAIGPEAWASIGPEAWASRVPEAGAQDKLKIARG